MAEGSPEIPEDNPEDTSSDEPKSKYEGKSDEDDTQGRHLNYDLNFRGHGLYGAKLSRNRSDE